MPHTCAHTMHKQTAIEESEDSQCRDGTDTPTVCVPGKPSCETSRDSECHLSAYIISMRKGVLLLVFSTDGMDD